MGFYYFFDASAIVKYYVDEPGSVWVKGVVDLTDPDTEKRANTVFIAEISITEAVAAFSVLHRTQQIRRRTRNRVFSRFLAEAGTFFMLIPIVSDDFYTAALLTQRHPLKAYDAIQLAVALRYHQVLAQRELGLIFVSGDRQQLAAAEAEGLATDNPFDHLAPSDSLTQAHE